MEKLGIRSVFRIWAILGLLAMIVIWFLPWRFQTNDDELMMWLVSGAYTGTPESYAVFIHPLLSWIFSKLYTLFPEIRWYPLTWFLVMYLGYLVFQFITLKTQQSKDTTRVWNLFFLALLVHFCFSIQFSIVASFAVTAGLAFRIRKQQSDGRIFDFYFTDILILIGSMIRFEILILSLTGCVFLSLLYLAKSIPLKSLLFPAAFGLGLFLVNLAWLQQNEMKEFVSVNKLRSNVFDHPVLQLNKQGFLDSNPDLYHFANGLIDFSGDEQLNQKKLLDWKKELDQRRFQSLSTLSLFNSLTVFIAVEHFLQGLILLFFGFSLFKNGKRAFYLILIILAGFILASVFTLLKVQIYALMLLFVIMNNLLWDQTVPLKKGVSIGFQILLIFAICYHMVSIFQSQVNVIDSNELSQNLLQLNQQGYDLVYLVGKEKYYHQLVFENPLPFKFLGWPTLLEASREIPFTDKKAYLIDLDTFKANSAYFNQLGFLIEKKGDFVQIVVR